MLVALIVALLAVLACVSADDAHERKMRARVNFKGESVGHSNYGRGFDERKKYVCVM